MRALRAGAMVATVAGLVLTVLGWFPGEDWRLDLLANFRLQFLFGFMILTATLFASAGRRWWWLGLAGLLIHGIAVAPWLGGWRTGPEPTDGLRILHLNVFAFNEETDAVVELIRSSDADIVFLAEATADWRRRLRTVELPYDLVATPGEFSLGILAYLRPGLSDLAETEVIAVSDFRLPTPSVTVELRGEPVTVLSFHTTSPLTVRRGGARDEQLEALGELLASIEGHGVLVGDLNATPWTPGLAFIEDAGYINSLRASGLQPSWPAGLGPFMIPIDHAFHSPGLQVLERRTVTNAGSDHLGVVVEFGLAGG